MGQESDKPERPCGGWSRYKSLGTQRAGIYLFGCMAENCPLKLTTNAGSVDSKSEAEGKYSGCSRRKRPSTSSSYNR